MSTLVNVVLRLKLKQLKKICAVHVLTHLFSVYQQNTNMYYTLSCSYNFL